MAGVEEGPSQGAAPLVTTIAKITTAKTEVVCNWYFLNFYLLQGVLQGLGLPIHPKIMTVDRAC